MHEATLHRPARGDADASADLAARLVALDPYEENFQVLLVRLPSPSAGAASTRPGRPPGATSTARSSHSWTPGDAPRDCRTGTPFRLS